MGCRSILWFCLSPFLEVLTLFPLFPLFFLGGGGSASQNNKRRRRPRRTPSDGSSPEPGGDVFAFNDIDPVTAEDGAEETSIQLEEAVRTEKKPRKKKRRRQKKNPSITGEEQTILIRSFEKAKKESIQLDIIHAQQMKRINKQKGRAL